MPEEYHLGGLEYDGRFLWATASQYRPTTTATLVQLDLSVPSSSSHSTTTLLGPVEPLWHIRDHQGGVIRDVSTQTLLTLNWGSRAASLWDLRDLRDPAAAPFPCSAQPHTSGVAGLGRQCDHRGTGHRRRAVHGAAGRGTEYLDGRARRADD
ncbi:hypothetical protein PG997_005857 [Apiospora hydei]|uniref:Uncharacterized protein n=1 Tax=Apiospora hydei TaxID=1337664 RepID=A0ABR1WM46_9PEZI